MKARREPGDANLRVTGAVLSPESNSGLFRLDFGPGAPNKSRTATAPKQDNAPRPRRPDDQRPPDRTVHAMGQGSALPAARAEGGGLGPAAPAARFAAPPLGPRKAASGTDAPAGGRDGIRVRKPRGAL